MVVEKIISGGQTGADTAGLYAALDLGISTGGTAPKGWRIENPDGTRGSNPELGTLFGLVEHESLEYPPRTKQNVADSDGIVWFGYEHSGGGKLTIGTAKKLGKPYKVNPEPAELREWLLACNIKVLNVAGNRASDLNPTIAQDTYKTLIEALKGVSDVCVSEAVKS